MADPLTHPLLPVRNLRSSATSRSPNPGRVTPAERAAEGEGYFDIARRTSAEGPRRGNDFEVRAPRTRSPPSEMAKSPALALSTEHLSSLLGAPSSKVENPSLAVRPLIPKSLTPLSHSDQSLLTIPWSNISNHSLRKIFPTSSSSTTSHPATPTFPAIDHSPTTPRPLRPRRSTSVIVRLTGSALSDSLLDESRGTSSGQPQGDRGGLFPPSPPDREGLLGLGIASRDCEVALEDSGLTEIEDSDAMRERQMDPYEALRTLGALNVRLVRVVMGLEEENNSLRAELQESGHVGMVEGNKERDTDQLSVHDSLTEALSTSLSHHSPHPSISTQNFISHNPFPSISQLSETQATLRLRPHLSSSSSASASSRASPAHGRSSSYLSAQSESTTPTSIDRSVSPGRGVVPGPSRTNGKRASWTGLFSWGGPSPSPVKKKGDVIRKDQGWGLGRAEAVVEENREVVEVGERGRRRSSGLQEEQGEADEDASDERREEWRGRGSSPAFRAIFHATRILTPDPSSVLVSDLPPTSLIAYLAHTLVSNALEEGIEAEESRSRRTSVSARSFDSSLPRATHAATGYVDGLQGVVGTLKDVWNGKGKKADIGTVPDARISLLRTLSTKQMLSPSHSAVSPELSPNPSTPNAKSFAVEQAPLTPVPAVELTSIFSRAEKPPTMLLRRSALDEYLQRDEELGSVASRFVGGLERDLSGYTDRFGFVYDLKHAKALLAEQKNLHTPTLGVLDPKQPEWQTIKRKPVTSPPLATPQQQSKPGSSRNSVHSLSGGERRGSDSASSILSASKVPVAAPVSPSLTLDTALRTDGSPDSGATSAKRSRSATISSIAPSPSKPAVSNQEVTVSSSGTVALETKHDPGPVRSYSGTIRTRVAKLDDLIPNNRKPVSALLSQLTETHDKEEAGRLKQWQSFLKHHQLNGKKASTSAVDDETQWSGDLLGLAQLGHNKHGTEERRALNRLVRTVGIPISLRAQVWAEFSGAKDAMVPGEYQEILEVHKSDDNPVLAEIEKDVGRTFASNVFFGGDGVGCQKLRRLLTAYAWHDPSIGYCQGMNLLAATLLLTYSSEDQAYWTFISLINQLLPPLYFAPSLLGSRVEQAVLEDFVQELLPKVWAKFSELGMGLSAVSFGWMLSLFTNCLPIETLFRVWDILFAEGSNVILRTALAILKLGTKSLLLCSSVPELFSHLNGLTERLWVPEKLIVVQNELKHSMTHEVIVKKREKWSRIFTADEDDS